MDPNAPSMRSTKQSRVAVDGDLGGALAAPRRLEPAARFRKLWRVARWGVFAGALIYVLLVLTRSVPYFATEPPVMMGDAAAYYLSDTPYDWSDRPDGVGEYRYAPAFLWLIAPLRLLPWEVFAVAWFVAHIGVVLYLRLPWMLAFPGVMEDAIWGNVNTFVALAVVLIVRHRAAPLWAFILLTKVTPGVAVVWHAARREWREFGVALGFTALIVVVGVVLEPRLWASWVEALIAAPGNYPAPGDSLAVLIPRVLVGAGIAVYAAVTNRGWLLPIGMLVAVPGFWAYSFALLLASVALYKERLTRVEEERLAAPETDPRPLNSRSSIRK